MTENERVTLQYSIKLQDLPREVSRLIGEASALQTGELAKKFRKLNLSEGYELLGPDVLHNIRQLRFVLSDIDATLGDIENIVSGYLEMRDGEGSQATSEISDEPAHESYDELADASELVDKLRLFREKGSLKNAEKPPADAQE